jgi:hypothetical protein
MRDPDAPLPDHFIREVCVTDILRPVLRHGIKSLVEWADTELDSLAGYCGATVVPHEWGLARRDRSTTKLEHDPFGLFIQSVQPKRGYDLVAKVARVDALPPPPAWESKLQEGTDRYAASARNYYYSDRKPNQFMFGTIADADPKTWLVDIDLLFLAARAHHQHFQPRNSSGSF